jgi:DNA invertase Pin-like site-specific DNA recombinase
MKRVAIYARVSTADQSTDMQLAELRDYVARSKWAAHHEYIDHGISGTKASRPELDKLMADARRRKFDVCAVWRFDRFARSTSHLLAALEEFRTLGIDFVSLHEALDTSTPMGKAMFTIVSAIAELERGIIVERVRAGVARARAKGKRLGRPPTVAVDPAAVSAMLRDGQTMRQVASVLKVSVGTVHRLKSRVQ